MPRLGQSGRLAGGDRMAKAAMRGNSGGLRPIFAAQSLDAVELAAIAGVTTTSPRLRA
jgi:hypothetical protein